MDLTQKNQTKGTRTSIAMLLILSVKMLLIGEQGCGRTAIYNQVVHEKFDSYSMAIPGIVTGYRMLNIAQKHVQLSNWDYPGKDVPFGSQSRFYDGAHAAFVVFDVSSEKSLKVAKKQIQLVRSRHPSIVIAVLGNKVDLPRKEWVIFEEELIGLAASDNVLTSFVSAKTGRGLQSILESTVLEVVGKQNTSH